MFGVVKPGRAVNGVETLRVIMNLIPSNALHKVIEASVHRLPSISQWTSIFLGRQEHLEISQADITSAFYLFELPSCWCRRLAFNLDMKGKDIGPDFDADTTYTLCARVPQWGDDLLRAMVARTLEAEDVSFGALLLLGYFGLLRTGELVALRIGDIRVSEASPKTSARRGQGEHVVIRDTSVIQFIRCLLRLRTAKHEAIWSFSPQKFRDLFADYVSFFRLQSYGYRPYLLRRGGATRLYRLQTPMGIILTQGRWKTSGSARTYIADGVTELGRLNLKPRTLALFAQFHALVGFNSP